MRSDPRCFALLCVLLGGMGQGVVAPKLPELLHGSSRLELDSGFSASLMYLGVFVASFRFGRLADRGRVHSLLVGGLAAYAAVLVGLGLCGTRFGNFGLRFLEGLCLSAIFVACDFLLGRLSDAKTRGKWLSLYGVALSAGLLLGPALSIGLERMSGTGSPLFPLVVVAGVALVCAAIALRMRVPALESEECGPVPRLNRGALASGVSYGFLESGLVAIFPAISLVAFGLAPELALIATIVVGAVSSVGWGEASDRFGPRAVLRVLFAIFVLGPAALVYGASGALSPHALAAAAAGVFGLLAGGIYPVGFAWLLGSIPESRYGYASGAFARAYGMGSLVGPLAAGILSQRWQAAGLFGLMAGAGLLGSIALVWLEG